jgi:hypothetical protein
MPQDRNEGSAAPVTEDLDLLLDLLIPAPRRSPENVVVR